MDSSSLVGSASRSLTSDVSVQPLIAGQHIPAGTVSVWRDSDTLFVQYATNSSFTIAETHVWVGTDVDGVPSSSGGLVNGHFDYNDEYSPSVSVATVEVPLGTWVEGTKLYIFTHAALNYTSGSGGETAYAGDKTYPVNRWNFYFEYNLPAAPGADLPEEFVSGFVFYDANNNGVKDAGEPGIPGIPVNLLVDGSPVTQTSAADGSYKFESLYPVEYTVSTSELVGFLNSTALSHTVTATAENVNFGFFVDYAWINGKTANGFTIGYWKNNIDKAIANRTNGIQVSKSTLLGYVSSLSSFALPPLNVDTLKKASDILSKTGSNPSDLLAKQLIASELNYLNGAYVDGNALATYFFLFQGEYLLHNSASFSASQLLTQKDYYDAYNNSHGGAILF
jgi:hypothetical protein